MKVVCVIGIFFGLCAMALGRNESSPKGLTVLFSSHGIDLSDIDSPEQLERLLSSNSTDIKPDDIDSGELNKILTRLAMDDDDDVDEVGKSTDIASNNSTTSATVSPSESLNSTSSPLNSTNSNSTVPSSSNSSNNTSNSTESNPLGETVNNLGTDLESSSGSLLSPNNTNSNNSSSNNSTNSSNPNILENLFNGIGSGLENLFSQNNTNSSSNSTQQNPIGELFIAISSSIQSLRSALADLIIQNNTSSEQNSLGQIFSSLGIVTSSQIPQNPFEAFFMSWQKSNENILKQLRSNLGINETPPPKTYDEFKQDFYGGKYSFIDIINPNSSLRKAVEQIQQQLNTTYKA